MIRSVSHYNPYLAYEQTFCSGIRREESSSPSCEGMSSSEKKTEFNRENKESYKDDKDKHKKDKYFKVFPFSELESTVPSSFLTET